MPRPVPRRRAERDAPEAEEYTSRRGRTAVADEEPAEERRPRRGRGELPARGRRAAAPEPEEEPTPSRRRRAAEPEPEPEEPQLPTLDELEKLDDDELFDVGVTLELWESGDEVQVDDAAYEELEEALKAALKPARGRRGRSAEPEPEAPARGRRSRRSEPEEPAAPARARRRAAADDEDEDDAPRRTARKGFQGFKKTREATSDFADDFKLTDEEVLVKFLPSLDDKGQLIGAEPFATYGEHGLYQELKEGQRVWPCLAPDEDCPVCDTGHNPRAVALWNIVVIPEEGKPSLKVLKAGPKLEKLLEKKSALKTGPLDKEYYSLSQTAGKNDGPVEYTVELVRERDLSDPDGWATEPFTDAELDVFIDKMHDETFVKFPSQRDMKDVARKLKDRD